MLVFRSAVEGVKKRYPFEEGSAKYKTGPDMVKRKSTREVFGEWHGRLPGL